MTIRGLLASPLFAASLPVVVALLGTPVHAAKVERLLILPLEHELGENAARMRPVEEAFREEAKALGRFQLLPAESTEALLSSVRSLGLECAPGDLECLTKAGVVMEIDLLAVLRAADTGNRLVVSGVLIDVATGRTRASVSRTLGKGDSLRAVLRSAAIELLAPDLYVGALDLLVSQQGAVVRIDGAPRGTTPLPASITGLAPGEHVVEITKEGFSRVERIVVIRPLESTQLAVELVSTGGDLATTEASGVGAQGEEPAVSSVPMMPIVLSSVAGAAILTAGGTAVGAQLLNERYKDVTLPVAERRNARLPGQVLLAMAATTAVVALVSGGAAALAFVP